MQKLKNAITTIVLMIIMLTLFPAAALADPQPAAADRIDLGFDLELNSEAVVFMNLDTGAIIYEKNADKQMHPASVTKIMTAALVMSMCGDLDGTIVTVPNGVWSEFNGDYVSNADLKAGEELTMNQLLHCLLLQSANEAAVTIAEYYGRDKFIKMMNDKAIELGCRNTNFVNPHGYKGDGHYTSASDLTLITTWALSVPGFWEITQKSRYSKAATNKNDADTLVTTIEMQDSSTRYYTPYIKGIKSGTLESAGRCLVTAARKDGVTYLLILLGAPYANSDRVWPDASSTYTDTRLCYDWAFEQLKLTNIVDPATAVAEIKIRHAAKRDNLLLYPVDDLFALVRNDDAQEHEIRYEFSELPESVNAPVKEGDIIGAAKVYYGDMYVGETNLIVRETVELDIFVLVMDGISDVLTSTAANIIYIILLIVVVMYLYYVLVVVPKARKKQRKRRLEEQRRRKG